ncbi:hypothetical protein [Pseudomonas sp. R3-52-08]|uniref:hypothetical protein n=1 Tax=Pseudomonas sp. R3-52-08 TaxID=1173284 RepID=UPI000F56366F|nr:hypothetical protein [Pseudomonas sp. R3-52-08]AZF22317.1 hypothetical protein C4J91_3574 [Pseudomonas sp. R3-52-08]
MARAIRKEQASSNVHAFPNPKVRDTEATLYEAKEGSVLHGLSEEQRIAVAELIQAERKHYSRWWTFLNEMRARKHLPDWVDNQAVGTGPEYDRYREDCEAVNLKLFGTRRVLQAGGYCSVEFDS